jgi:hypothetical protein
VVEVAENMPENMPAPETEQPEPTGNVRKTKLELAQEALPREEFEEFIRQGFTDQQVADLKGLELYLVKRIKQKYGLVGIVERRRKPMAFEIYRGDVGSKGEKMTVARALKVREEIVADIQCVEKNIPAEMLTPGVKAALDDLVKRGKDMLERIDRALETLEIEV